MVDVDGCMFMSSHCAVLKPIISFAFNVSHVTVDIATLHVVLVRGQMSTCQVAEQNMTVNERL